MGGLVERERRVRWRRDIGRVFEVVDLTEERGAVVRLEVVGGS